MAKKTRKVLKQESQQRARQQAMANVSAGEVAAASAAASAAVVAAPAAPARATKVEATDEQDFTFVRSDVRRSLTLAGIFAAAMIVLSFVLR